MDYPRIEESTLCQGRRVVIACRVMEPELTKVLVEAEEEVEVLYLDQALHRTPTKLLGQLQEKIDQVAREGLPDRPGLRPLLQRRGRRHGASAGAAHPPLS